MVRQVRKHGQGKAEQAAGAASKEIVVTVVRSVGLDSFSVANRTTTWPLFRITHVDYGLVTVATGCL